MTYTLRHLFLLMLCFGLLSCSDVNPGGDGDSKDPEVPDIGGGVVGSGVISGLLLYNGSREERGTLYVGAFPRNPYQSSFKTDHYITIDAPLYPQDFSIENLPIGDYYIVAAVDIESERFPILAQPERIGIYRSLPDPQLVRVATEGAEIKIGNIELCDVANSAQSCGSNSLQNAGGAGREASE